MNTEHFKNLLGDKERELRINLTGLKAEERVPPGVGNSIDAATASQTKSESFQEGSVLSQMLEQVQDAQHRFTDGSYGKCILYGREIELSRLEAVSWTAYCLEDQEKRDRTSSPGQIS